MNIIKHKKIFFGVSAGLSVIAVVAIALFGLKPSIEFTGGSRFEFSTKQEVSDDQVREIYGRYSIEVISVQRDEDQDIIVRSVPISQQQKTEVARDLQEEIGIQEKTFETVGPTIGSEARVNAFKAVIIATGAILMYIAFIFRKVSHPVASWKYGVSAIVALLHDTLITVGAFAILGRLFGVEVDTLFITALLTVMGFSVHDTIVVFDRVREHLKKDIQVDFEQLVNTAVFETFARSVNTSMTVILVLTSLLLFSGEGIRWFLVALLIGIIIGTYSSIFTASPLLVAWYQWDKKRVKK